jgi:hypothetical protein
MKKNLTRYSSRKTQKKLNPFLKEKLLIKRNIWQLIVLARLLSFLSLLFTYYLERH